MSRVADQLEGSVSPALGHVRDPIAVEIIRSALSGVAEEMGITAVRGGYSSFIKEGADASAAILSWDGQLIAQSSGTLLLHASSLRMCAQSVLADYPAETMAEGDVFLMNDPARGGVHSNDVAVFRPVFAGGKLVFFTAALVHVADLGGVSGGGLPAQATEIFHEGLLLPPVRLYRAGQTDEIVRRIIQLNSRTPEKVMGDIRALVAGCNVGAERLAELIGRYGYRTLADVIEDLLDYTELRMRQGIEQLPVEPCFGEFTIDDDGIDLTKSYTVRVKVQRSGSDLVIDFTGTDPEARGAINASSSQALTGALYGARCFLDPSIPMNEGCFRPLKVILPTGTLVQPGAHKAVNARIVTVTAMIEAMLDAVAKQQPQRAVAGSGIVHMQMVSGQFPDSSKYWIMMDLDFGGVGARSTKDGVDTTGANLMSGRGGVSQLEALEAEFPLVFERHALIPDSGGAGTWRGGLGVERTMRVLADVEISVRADRMRFPPPGRAGGEAGRAGSWIVNRGRADERVLGSKQMGVRLVAGDTLTLLTSGGGGYGPASQRDPAMVALDIENGRITEGGAAASYGYSTSP